MSNQEFNITLSYGELERPRNETKLVLPITITAAYNEKQVDILYLVDGENLNEINTKLEFLHKDAEQYALKYISQNLGDDIESYRATSDAVLVELGRTIEEAFKKTGSVDANILTPCTEEEQDSLNSLCREVGINPIVIPEGTSKIQFWVIREALKKVAVRAKVE